MLTDVTSIIVTDLTSPSAHFRRSFAPEFSARARSTSMDWTSRPSHRTLSVIAGRAFKRPKAPSISLTPISYWPSYVTINSGGPSIKPIGRLFQPQTDRPLAQQLFQELDANG
jgi:hypothetical protein